MLGSISGLQLFSSSAAVVEDGTKEIEVRRSIKERLFSWKPWITTKTITVPNYKPAMFRVGNRIVYHPSLEQAILRAVER